MLFKKSPVILFTILFFLNVNAQEFKLGKVSIAELEEKEHPIDPSADAAILFKKGQTIFEYDQNEGFVMITKVQTRIKIYKKEGNEWANQEVKYYLGSDLKETVSFSDAVTYNLVNGKIEKTKLKNDGEFDEKINKYWGRKKIVMPNVKEGSVMEFEYMIRSPRYGALKEWYFQTSIPVNYSEYKTFIPEYFIYNTNQKGFVSPKITVENSPKSITFTNKDRDEYIGKTTFSYDKVDYQETKTTYLSENLPAMKEEAFVNNVDNYTSSISHELSMTHYPNQPLKKYSTDWEAVVKTIYNYDDFGTELNKTGYFEDNINTLIAGLSTQNEKLAAIFNFVKSNVKWNNYYNYYCNDGVRKAYKDKTGNVAEINLMLTAMLRFAKIDANPVLISTRSNGIALFPSTTAFDYVIAAVETPDGLILLDATEKFSMPNVLPLRDLNWFGRLIRKDGTSTQVDLMPKTLSREAVNVNVILKSDSSVDGKIRRQFTDHEALEFRQKKLLTNKDTYLEELENKNNSIEISDYVRENDLDLSKAIVETYSFKDTKDVEVINDKIYISPMLFLATKENPFKQEVREYPVDYGFPFMDKYAINIQIPEGYTVEMLPASTILNMQDNLGSFKFITNLSGNTIQLSILHQVNSAIISSEYYSMLKEYYQGMIAKQNEKIVLIKK